MHRFFQWVQKHQHKERLSHKCTQKQTYRKEKSPPEPTKLPTITGGIF